MIWHKMGNLKKSTQEFYMHVVAPDGDAETISLTQSMEAPNADHWRIELNLTRWRTKKDLADYLRTAASIVEGVSL